jgi:hypothetical protein
MAWRITYRHGSHEIRLPLLETATFCDNEGTDV